MNLDNYYDKGWRQQKRNDKSLWFLYGASFVCLLMIFAHSCAYNEPEPVLKKSHAATPPSMRQIQMAEYFRRKGSPIPQKMAEAVLKTTKPRLMASIAIRESCGDPKATGDGGKSKGAFQVQKKHWGVVSKDVVEQALQSERILDNLLVASGGNLKVALNKYGGDKTKKVYAKNILKEAENIP